MGRSKALRLKKRESSHWNTLGPKWRPDGIVELVAQDRRQREQHERQRQADESGARERTDDEQQRVARQEGHDDQAGLDEDDKEQQGIDPGAVAVDEGVQVLVDMEDEIDQEGMMSMEQIITAARDSGGLRPANLQSGVNSLPSAQTDPPRAHRADRSANCPTN